MNTDKHADVLVVIPCLNEAAHLPHLLEWLTAETGDDALIVVADGGSHDGSRQIVEAAAERWPKVRLLANPGRIQSIGVNAAVAQYGRGRRHLIRIDAHAGYPKGFIRGLIETARTIGAQSVTVPMRTIGEGCFQRAAAAAQNSFLGAGGSAHRQGAASGWVDHGHHALMDLTAFREVGGYDEGFSHNEDAELDLRLTQEGGRIWLAADLAILYRPRSRPGALFTQYRNYGRGRAMTAARHKVRLKPRQAAPLLVAPSVAAAVIGLGFAPITPLALGLAAPAAAWAGLCLGLGVLTGLKVRDRCAMLSGVAAMIMHLGWSLGFWGERLSATLQPPRLPLLVRPAVADA
ncbi:glycosyltransferase family 2 protein [Caulobacter segnis]|uniref:glycosyltransferase family 2 protein n=1 Tax=Caulobacter segnis TaxID=88688 RepID=UPI00240FAE97|nr:glycosyltransferase family 2 protein [Caulobacter segnis]MDG2520312.1 glycosyltransferase family 2 protein [Caulobacter segnis]